jgi:hypothetical protein
MSTARSIMAQNRNRHWTLEDDIRLCELLASRVSFSVISVEFGRDLAAVKARARKFRRELEPHPSASQNTQDIDRRARQSWTEQDVRTLRDLSMTETVELIAKQLNRSVNSARLKAFWLRLPLGRR